MHVGESIVPTAVTGNAKGVRNRFLKNRVFGSFMRFRFGFQIANHTLQASTCSPEILGDSRVLLVTRIKPLGAAIEAICKSSGPATPRNQHLEMSAD